MTNALLSMQYPEWLIVIGATLALLGLIGLAIFGNKVTETELDEEVLFGEGDHKPAKSQIELALEQQEERKAKLSRQAKTRWDDQDNSAEGTVKPNVTRPGPK